MVDSYRRSFIVAFSDLLGISLTLLCAIEEREKKKTQRWMILSSKTKISPPFCCWNNFVRSSLTNLLVTNSSTLRLDCDCICNFHIWLMKKIEHVCFFYFYQLIVHKPLWKLISQCSILI